MINKLVPTLAAALAIAGCASATPMAPMAKTPLLNVSTQLAFNSPARHVMALADTVTKVTGSNVSSVDVYLQELAAGTHGIGTESAGAPAVAADLDAMNATQLAAAGWSKATVSAFTVDATTHQLTGATVSFANLKYGTNYAILAVAKGTNPNTGATNAILSDVTNTYLSGAELDTPVYTANDTVYQQNVTPGTTSNTYMHSLSSAIAQTSTAVDHLTINLTDVAYQGFANNIGITVNNGQVVHNGNASIASPLLDVLYFVDLTHDVMSPSTLAADGTNDVHLRVIKNFATPTQVNSIQAVGRYYGNWTSNGQNAALVGVSVNNGPLVASAIGASGTIGTFTGHTVFDVYVPDNNTPVGQGYGLGYSLQFNDNAGTNTGTAVALP